MIKVDKKEKKRAINYQQNPPSKVFAANLLPCFICCISFYNVYKYTKVVQARSCDNILSRELFPRTPYKARNFLVSSHRDLLLIPLFSIALVLMLLLNLGQRLGLM
jgi:hypothetical protein